MKTSTYKICVIGLGYVGLPLARLFSTKFETIGFDMNQERVDALMAGHDATLEVSDNLLQDAINNHGFKCTTSLEDIKEVFAAGGVDRIMFDNFSVEQTREAVALVAGRCETESSGGITLETLRDYAETGVDFISVGALTHQIKSLDMSLKAC